MVDKALLTSESHSAIGDGKTAINICAYDCADTVSEMSAHDGWSTLQDCLQLFTSIDMFQTVPRVEVETHKCANDIAMLLEKTLNGWGLTRYQRIILRENLLWGSE